MSNDWLLENIEGIEESELEVTEWDVQKIEAAEFENHLVVSGYYNRTRWINE